MKKTDAIKAKIYSRQEVKPLINRWRLVSKSIAFTNGVFDILHAGHIKLLSEAAKQADMLIVAINSDDSVKRLKGNSRPVNSQDDRALVMASFIMVDAVVIFDEDTPLELIKLIEPDFLIKGGDYKEDTVVGNEVMKAIGGKVVIIPLEEGYSTTKIFEQIRKQQ